MGEIKQAVKEVTEKDLEHEVRLMESDLWRMGQAIKNIQGQHEELLKARNEKVKEIGKMQEAQAIKVVGDKNTTE